MVNKAQTTSRGDKRQAVLETALRLFVEQGFHQTSTASIAKHAGVATGTLFHHFNSKNALLDALFLSIKQEFAQAILKQVSLPIALNVPTASSGPIDNPESAMNSTKMVQAIELNTFRETANAIWQAAIDWALSNPYKQRFFLHYSMSSEVTISARNEAMNSILGFITHLLTQGQSLNFIAAFPIPLMLENCHGQYLASIRFFTDNPAFGNDPQYRQASFELFWRAIQK